MPASATAYQLREEAAGLRTQRAKATTELARLEARLVQAEERLARLVATSSPDTARYGDIVQRLRSEFLGARAARDAAEAALGRNLTRFSALQPATDVWELLERSAPVLFLPVRLEVRFDNGELLVRVYPDAIHEDAHERSLSAVEAAWAKRHWQRLWRAGDDADELRAAWQELVDRFGTARAGWVRRALTPTNLADMPSRRVPPGQDPFVRPRFPAESRRPGTWSTPPEAALLPDRWVALTWVGGIPQAPVWGAPVAPVLPTAPDIARPAGQQGLPGVDEGMAWMTDPADAEARGMLLRVPLGGATKVDRLVVLGVRASMDSEAGAAAFADLLDAHRYTRGLGLHLPGEATNNAAERSAHGGPPADTTGLGTTRVGSPPASASGSDGDRLAAALGIRGDALGGLGTDTYDDAHSRELQTLLWQPCWGAFLEQLTTAQPPPWLPDIRSHWIDWVRGGGPYPVLRVADQPYGVLPVVSSDRWKPLDEPAVHGEVVALLREARGIWASAVGDVAHVGHGGGEAVLLDVLAQEPGSGAVSARPVFGREFLRNFEIWAGQPPENWPERERAALATLTRLARSWTPRIGRALLGDRAVPLGAPLTTRGLPASLHPEGDDGYLLLIAEATLDDLRHERLPGLSEDHRVPLLYVLVRHAALLEVRRAALNLVPGLRLSDAYAADPRDPELVDVRVGQPPSTVWELLGRSVQLAPGARSVRLGAAVWERRLGRDLAAFSIALERTRDLSAARIDRGVREALDLASHRLDGWLTSYAARRASASRSRRATGLHLGGYGWLEGLEASPRVPATPPAGEGGPLWTARANGGWMHAPGVQHAVTAAVMRSAQLAHQPATDGAGAMLDLDLSSRRVRDAERILDGVRHGRGLAELLGYRIERALRDASLSAYVAPLRRIAPAVAGSVTPSGGAASDTIAAANVVDGLTLLRLWHEEREQLAARDSLPAHGDSDWTAFAAVLDAVQAELDATGDVVTAEAVHQAVLGNAVRANAGLGAIASGSVPPPELDFLRTPRSGIALTTRLLVTFEGAESPAGWQHVSPTPRATADPALEGWARTLLPSPSRVLVQLLAGPQRAHQPITLDRLGICALDLLAYPQEGPGPVPPRLARRLIHAAVMELGLDPTAAWSLDLARGTTWDDADLGVDELALAAQQVRALLYGARPLRPEDLCEPGRPATAEHLIAGVAAGLDDAAGLVRNAVTAVTQASHAADLAAALLVFDGAGVDDSFPVVPPSHPHAADLLPVQAARAAAVAQDRLTAYAALPAGANASTLQARRAAIFGEGGPPLPVPFVLDDSAALAASLTDPALADARDQPLAWLAGVSEVRGPTARLHRVLADATLLRATAGDASPAPWLAQLPHRPGQRWNALPVDSTRPGDDSASVALVLVGAQQPDVRNAVNGLMVDEWVETLPSNQQATGVSFHFDSPGASPPQALLLAVPAEAPVSWRGPSSATATQDAWTFDELESVVLEALELAKARMVSLDHLVTHRDLSVRAVGHLLPATVLAYNAAGDTISSDPKRCLT